jgi:hypothetical protein
MITKRSNRLITMGQGFTDAALNEEELVSVAANVCRFQSSKRTVVSLRGGERS